MTRKAIELAKGGDAVALRLCLERILPARKDRPVSFDIPLIANASEAAILMGAILAAVASGGVTLCEAGEVAKVVAGYVEALKASEFEERRRALETRPNGNIRKMPLASLNGCCPDRRRMST